MTTTNMPHKLRKGQLLVKNLNANWLIETGENPDDYNIVVRILSMTDEEFDSYLNDKPYVQRQLWSEDTETKELERQEKFPKTKNIYTKRND